MNEQFRRGFLYGLASMGLTPEAFGELVMSKQSSFGGALSGIGDVAGATLIGGPLVAGALGGSLAAKLTALEYDTSVENIRQAELLRQLKLQTRQLNRRNSPAPLGASRGLLPSSPGPVAVT